MARSAAWIVPMKRPENMGNKAVIMLAAVASMAIAGSTKIERSKVPKTSMKMATSKRKTNR
jgi:hypothetical protein